VSASLAAVTREVPRPSARTIVLPLGLATDERLVGGKARNLARLLQIGAPVPDGVVLTCGALNAVLRGSGLTVDHNDARDVVLRAALPRDVHAALRDIGETRLGQGPLAVRSSAVGEDGLDASFAGQFDSVLGVTTQEALHDAVRRCWASFWSERAVAYRRARRLAPRGMGIVIHRQVAAGVAGVLFTRHPDPNQRLDDMVIEYCGGLADRLVAGQVDPGRLEVSRASLTVSTREHPADGSDADPSRLLTPRRLEALATLALRIERALGGPQDIEWAIDHDGQLAIVQTRPITARAAPLDGGPAPRVLWSNANVRENFPDPISPLLYSIAARGYYGYFRSLGVAFGISRRRLAAMERPLRGIIGVHGARMYYNLTNIHAVLRMAPFGDGLARAFNLFVGADETAEPPARAAGWDDRRSRVRQALEITRIGAATAWQYVHLGRRLKAFERTADAFATRTSEDALTSASLADLGERLGEFLEIRFHRWKNAALCDAAAMVTYALLEWQLTRHGFSEATHTRLLTALPGVPSSRPPIELWKLSRLVRAHDELCGLFRSTAPPQDILRMVRCEPRFETFRHAFQRYLDTWGFRSSGELMLTVPSLVERPDPVIDLLRQYVLTDGESPEAARARQVSERRRETRRVLAAIARRAPVQALAVWMLVRWTQRSIAYRERARLKQALLYTRCRRVALGIGRALVLRGQLATPDQVFMLTFQEIEELASGRAMLADGVRALVELRQREHATAASLQPPDTMRLEDTVVFSARDRRDPNPDRRLREDERLLCGTSACGGHVSARAAVLADVSEAHRLRRGDVLVTKQTDPGWGPVFCLVSGLVIERGGMLSHGAILAREFGLPCVVGIQDATRRIRHGARVTVDGDQGTCEVEGAS
jgi:pyruvate,water dikinase